MIHLKWTTECRRNLLLHLVAITRINIPNHYKYSIILSKSTAHQHQCHHYKSTWSILFFGVDKFSLESLRRIHNQLSSNLISRLEVVTSYKGDNENDFIAFTTQHNIKLHSWPITFPITGFDIGVIVSFGHMIPSWIIQSFPLGMINVHASLLPRWRGAAPIVYSLMHGDTTTGVTIMKVMPDKFDTGDILAQTTIDIHPDETHPELYDKLANIGGELLIETIEQLPDVINNGLPQSDNNATYARKITRKLSHIHWNKMTALNVYNLQRALTGLYPLITFFNGEQIKLLDIKCSDKQFLNSTKLIPGLVTWDKKNSLINVQCQDGNFVSVKQISMLRRRKMTANDFYNGFMNNSRKRVIFTDKNNTS